jgi:hypothetical protein
MELIFSTPHGSRLYGLNHTNSDHDRFEVYGYDKFKPKQKIVGTDDVVKSSLDRFLLYCDKGVPQYLEAMFSQMATVDKIEGIRETYVPNMTHVRDTYKRTIKSFWLAGVEDDDFKRRRHAWRLWLNLREMESNGRFDPTLHDFAIEFVTNSADKNHAWFNAPPGVQEEE